MSGATSSFPRIFVSHSHEDNEFGVKLVNDLRAALGGDETTVWYDVSGGLHPGEAWWDKIVAEITARPIFLVVLSPEAMRSQWVSDEVRIAWTLKNSEPNRLIVPLLWRECQVRADLASLQWINFTSTKPYEAALTELVERLRQNAQQLGATTDPARQTSSPADTATALAAKIVPQIEGAGREQDWQAVVDKAEYLTRYAPATVPPSVYRLYGRALLELGELKRAREALDVALALDPTDVPTLLSAARVRRGLGQEAEAAPVLRDALALVNNSGERLALLREYAAVLMGVKQWDELLRRADEALRLAPEESSWLSLRLTSLTELHRKHEALEVARKLTARPEATAAQWLARARLARAVTNDDTEVRSAFEAAARLAGFDSSEIISAGAELLPAPWPIEQFPALLARLGFGGHSPGGFRVIIPPVVSVPAGEFLMGSDKQRDPQAYDDELPQHSVTLPDYHIGKFPVTVAEYACFVRSGHTEPQNWQSQLAKPDHPAVYISWRDAVAYVAWIAKLTEQPWRLPTEAEWEKAARWDQVKRQARIYPWGDVWNKARGNTGESGINTTTPVGHYPSGASPCGALDMAGNVWEWTSSIFQAYPYQQTDGLEDANSAGNRVLRGGSRSDLLRYARAACRRGYIPTGVYGYVGFRLVLASPTLP